MQDLHLRPFGYEPIALLLRQPAVYLYVGQSGTAPESPSLQPGALLSKLSAHGSLGGNLTHLIRGCSSVH